MGRSLFRYTGDTKALLQINKKADINLKDQAYSKLNISQLSFLEQTLEVDPQKRAKSSTLIEQFHEKFESKNRIASLND